MTDKHVSPSIKEFSAFAEMTRIIEEQAREIERLSAGGAKEYWRGRCMDAEMALKAQPSGVVLDGAERCSECSTITARLDGDGCAKWCCHCGARLNGDYVHVASLNSPPVSAGGKLPDEFVCDSKPLQELLNATVLMFETPSQDSATYFASQLANVEALLKPASAGVADERAAFEAHYHLFDLSRDTLSGSYVRPDVRTLWDAWQARAALTAQPDHSAQSLNMVIMKAALEAIYDTDYQAPHDATDEDISMSKKLCIFRMRKLAKDALEAAAPAPGKEIE